MKGTLDTVDRLDSRQFLLAIKKLANTFNYGTDRSPFLGSGIEYVQSRPYQPGDPIRAIDWRITARTGRVFIKEYEAPKQMPCYLLIDTSASMMIQSGPRSKYATALHIAGGLAFACLDRVSPVGVVGLGESEFRMEPSLSAGQVLQWLHKLRHFRYDESTLFSRRIAQLAPTLNSRSLIIALTDLHDSDGLPALKLLAQRHDCVVLQLQDPAELGLPGAGFLRAGEAESNRMTVVRGRHTGIDTAESVQLLKRAGVDHRLVRVDQPFAADLRQFFKARNLLGRGAR
ncbi:MAG: DUF58 domain-containing protein [Gemmataceae bacterium]